MFTTHALIQMKRTALIINRDLSPGRIGNVCAILMAEIARVMPDALANAEVTDLDGLSHAAPQYSIVVLKANSSEQLQNIATATRADRPELHVFGFGAVGQNINNQFAIYQGQVANLTTADTQLMGLAISGDDSAVRQATKKFSVM